MKKTSVTTHDEIATIYRINQFMGSINDLDELLRQIMQEAAKTVEAEASSIALYNERTKRLCFNVALGKQGFQLKRCVILLGQGILGAAAQTKKGINIADVTKDKRFFSGMDKKTGFHTKAVLAVPIVRKEKLIGALEVLNKKGGRKFSAGDMRLLEIVAGQAAVAIENAQLYQQLKKKHQALGKKHKELIQTQAKIVQMERMSAIGEMSARIVHDVRNPLSIIRGYGDFLKEEGIGDDDRKKFAKIITDEVDRLTGLTNELMEFTKGKSSFLIKEHQLGDFFQETGEFLSRDFQKYNIELVTNFEYTGPIHIDRFKLQRAILNFGSNARDAMAAGGQFRIETRLYKNDMVEMTFSDTGSGIPQKVIDRIFEPFVTYGKKHGTGLGMAIVKKVVDMHKGTIFITSPAPQAKPFNTVITIRLPLTSPDVVQK